MASYYELTQDEVRFLLDTMELYRQERKFWTDEEVKDFKELHHYLKTRERPPITFIKEPL